MAQSCCGTLPARIDLSVHNGPPGYLESHFQYPAVSFLPHVLADRLLCGKSNPLPCRGGFRLLPRVCLRAAPFLSFPCIFCFGLKSFLKEGLLLLFFAVTGFDDFREYGIMRRTRTLIVLHRCDGRFNFGEPSSPYKSRLPWFLIHPRVSRVIGIFVPLLESPVAFNTGGYY